MRWHTWTPTGIPGEYPGILQILSTSKQVPSASQTVAVYQCLVMQTIRKKYFKIKLYN